MQGTDLHVARLRDRNEFSDPDGVAASHGISSAAWPIFGQVWDSGLVLADLMCTYDVDGLRVLELGCGLGLASLVLNQRGGDVTSTDRHPMAEPFLQHNAFLNGGPEIPFVRTGWEEPDCGMGTFDLIVASDVLYERIHVAMLAGFIDRHAEPDGSVVVVGPGRGHLAAFNKQMVRQGYVGAPRKLDAIDVLEGRPSGRVLELERGRLG